MSNKSTPVKHFQARNSNSSIRTPGKKQPTNATAQNSANGVRKKLATWTPKYSADKLKREDTMEQQLNTAFCSGLLTPRYKSRPVSTTLNACYTPSSLYRNIKYTPVRQNITASTPSTNGKQQQQQNKSSTCSLAEISSTEEMSHMIVAVRVRPLNALECRRSTVTNVVLANSNELTVNSGTSADASAGVTHFFSYDHVFYSCDPESKQYACQAKVFEGTALPLIETAFEGYNACLFAYGQTGSGKSYSMMGLEALDDAALDGSAPHPEAGIIPRFCHELFRRIDAVKNHLQVEIEVSYFEIYNEKIHDLLCVQQVATTGVLDVAGSVASRQALKVREHPIWGPYVVDLSVHCVDSYTALRNWLAVGNSQRATAATAMNDKSSRSHSIFNIVLNLTDIRSDSSTASDTNSGKVNQLRQTRRSKISLVDLAGSERISGTNGERIREGVNINKSLLALGKVIAALADTKKCGSAAIFVPYRDSVLTWLLRENLGGNSKTVMLATISPASVHVEETLATLRYACKARSIVNRVKVNESPHDKIIRDLRAEVERLKSLRNEYERQRRLSASNLTPRKIIIETSVDDSEVEALRQQLAERERELRRAEKSWMEKLKDAEDQRKSELRLLRRRGLALELAVEQKQACLVNLTADPILSGTLFYLLPLGTVRIGHGRGTNYATQPDIVLDGPLVGQLHCTIEHEFDKLYVRPENEEFETYLNGELLQSRQQMYHGDRLVIGGSHYFRISNPLCAQRDKNKLVDFQLAHQEILQKQEQKLRLELEEEKRAVLGRIEMERAKHERDFNERLETLELEQLKYQGKHELLETERQALEAQQAKQQSVTLMPTSAHKSTLLDDINRIMLQPSEESLHKTQLMVKEATQRCRALGLNFEFMQSQAVDEFGILRSIILILDKPYGLKAEWPIARLGVWLDMMRDSYDMSALNARTIFQSVEIEWQPMDAELNETLSDSNNTSRIAFNLSAVKDMLLKHPLKRLIWNNNGSDSEVKASTPSKILRNTSNLTETPEHVVKKKLTYDNETPGQEQIDPNMSIGKTIFIEQITMEIVQMRRHMKGLQTLCKNTEHTGNQEFRQQLLSIINNMMPQMEALGKLINYHEAISPTKSNTNNARFFMN